MSFLKLQKVYKYYGKFCALNDISLSVEKGEVRAIIGPNGAGKSTLLKVISGEIRAESGKISFKEQEINSWPVFKIRRKRISRSFQQTKITPSMTVLNNIKVAVQCFTPFRYSIWSSFECNKTLNQKAIEILDILGLCDCKDQLAGLLSYADQRKIDLAIALAGEPEILLLDEPTGGMSIEESQRFGAIMSDLCKEKGITLIFVEHDMDVVFQIAQKIAVLNYGHVLIEGLPQEIVQNEKVQRIYIGS